MGASAPFLFCILVMVATIYIVALVLAVLFITYPKDFPALISNPKLLFDAAGMETKRRWMILKLGTQLWFSRQRMRYSLWQMRHIIAAEKAKQQQQETK
jgi:hypothetical protein